MLVVAERNHTAYSFVFLTRLSNAFLVNNASAQFVELLQCTLVCRSSIDCEYNFLVVEVVSRETEDVRASLCYCSALVVAVVMYTTVVVLYLNLNLFVILLLCYLLDMTVHSVHILYTEACGEDSNFDLVAEIWV